MAVSTTDMNQIRVDVLGGSVDQATAWTTMPPGAANTLNTADRIVNRAINTLDGRVTGALNGTNGFAGRFSSVVGEEASADQAAFASIGSNLIQAVAALIAGGGLSPTLSFAFAFPDPITTGDFVEVTVTANVTIDADLDGAEYTGAPQTDDMVFELTAQPSGDVIGEIAIGAGNVVSLSGLGGEIAAGTVLRMTADDIVGGSVSPGAVITIAATRAVAPPPAAGSFVHTQAVAATTWTITHNLGFAFVSAQVVSGGNTLIPDIRYDSNTVCTLLFAEPRNGTAILRK